jgi:hypothetical protein
MKSRLRNIFIVASFGLVLSSYISCGNPSQFGRVNGTSTVGNPMTSLVIAPYTPDGSAQWSPFPKAYASVSGLIFCARGLTLRPSNSSIPDVFVSFGSFMERPIFPGGLDLGSLPIPVGDYVQIKLELSNVCGAGRSLAVANSQGSFQTPVDVSLSFNGSVTVDGLPKTITFSIQSIVNNLDAVNADNQVPVQATASPGLFH